MNNVRFSRIVLWTAFLLTGMNLNAQIYAVDPGSTFSVDGTSTLHDWTASVGEVYGTVTLDPAFAESDLPATGLPVQAVDLRIPVSSMDGGRGETMNDKLRKALRATEYPEIVFTLTTGAVSSIDAGQGAFSVDAAGELSMAGQTRPVEMKVSGRRNGDGYTFTGSHSINMTEYGITPPSAMFGQIVTGEEVEVNFELIVKAK